MDTARKINVSRTNMFLLRCTAVFLASTHTACAGGSQACSGKIVSASAFIDMQAPDCGLQKAIDSVPRGGMLVLPKGRYLLKRSLVLKSGMALSGMGEESILTITNSPACSHFAVDAGYQPVKLPKATEAKAPPDNKQLAAAHRIPVKDATGFVVGMELTLRDNRNLKWGATFATITQILGNTLVLDRPLMKRLTVSNNAVAANVFPGITGKGQADITIQFLRIETPGITNWVPSSFVLAGVHLVHCTNVLITRCTIDGWPSDGFSIQGGKNVRVMENVAVNNRVHGFHPGSGLKDSFWSLNRGEGNGYMGLYYCWQNHHTIVSHNKFINNRYWGIGRLGDGGDKNCLVYDNYIVGNAAAGIEAGCYNGSRNFIYENTLIDNCTNAPGPAIVLDHVSRTVVAKNKIITTKRNKTQIKGVAETGRSQNNYIVANTIKGIAKQDLLGHCHETTITEDTFPGSIPKERLEKLDELLALDAANMKDWKIFSKTLSPPTQADSTGSPTP